MKSEFPKVLFEINDEPLCVAGFRALAARCDRIVVVVGYRGGDVRQALTEAGREMLGPARFDSVVVFVTQDPPKGTGDAVRHAVETLGKGLNAQEEVIVLNGDLPLVRPETLDRLVKPAQAAKLESACLSVYAARPQGLGRILRDDRGVFSGIREEKDASPEEKRIREVNGGLYYFKASALIESVGALKSDNAQGEFYLTDLLGNRAGQSLRSQAILLRNPYDLLGVNTTWELASVRKIAQARLQKRLCEDHGVDFKDPATTIVSARAYFGGACTIGPGTVILGKSRIEPGVTIEGNVYVENGTIGAGAKIHWGSVIREGIVGPRSAIGPMAHLRPGTELGEGVRIGNFVETKKTKMGAHSKAAHLSYLGDATVGDDANIGCGTITCNYDGFNKYPTRIGSRSFVGSDVQLIAPVTVGDDAYVGSGTAVTQDVPSGALALSRAELIIKPGYAKRLADKKKPKGS
jgi:bifunctional UDP-N-acetylglucosamine pyrophosphorylase/glucosamine-1-phosphate N-acetyltransferase